MEDCPGIRQLYDYFTYKRQRRLGEISDEKRALCSFGPLMFSTGPLIIPNPLI